MPAVMNPRRERRRTWRSTAASFSASRATGSGAGAGSGAGSGTTGSSVMDYLDTDDHRPEVVPAGADDLRDVNDEEGDVADGDPEVKEASHRVSAEKKRQPSELDRLVDRQSGEQRSETHEDDGAVGNLLRAVELSVRRRLLAQMKIVQRDLNRFHERPAVRNQRAPLAGEERVENVEDPVDGEDPHEEKVQRDPFRQPVSDVQLLVGLFGDGHLQQRVVAQTDAVDGIGPVDEQAAPDHQRQDG